MTIPFKTRLDSKKVDVFPCKKDVDLQLVEWSSSWVRPAWFGFVTKCIRNYMTFTTTAPCTIRPLVKSNSKIHKTPGYQRKLLVEEIKKHKEAARCRKWFLR